MAGEKGEVDKLPVPPGGLQGLLGDANALSELLGLFQGRPGGTTTETTQQGNADLATILMQQALESNQGLAAVSTGQRRAGMYNTTTNQMLTNDLLARSSAEIAKATSPTVRTINGPSTPQQLDPTKTALGMLGIQLGGKLVRDTDWGGVGDSISSFFSAPTGFAEAAGGYEMASAYDNLDFGFEDTGYYDSFSPEFADFGGEDLIDFGIESFADYDFGAESFAADDEFFNYSDYFEGFANGGMVPRKKHYASGGRVERDTNLLSLYNSPDAVDRVSNRGRTIPAPRARIRPEAPPAPVRIRQQRPRPEPARGLGEVEHRAGSTTFDRSQGQDRDPDPLDRFNGPKIAMDLAPFGTFALRAALGAGGILGTAALPIHFARSAYKATDAAADRRRSFEGQMEYVNEQADRELNEISLRNEAAREINQGGYIPGGPSAAADRANAGAREFRAGPDNWGGEVREVRTYEPPSFGGRDRANGGLIRGHDRKGLDTVPINVSGGEVVIPTDVVDAIGAGFFDELIQMFHKPIPTKG